MMSKQQLSKYCYLLHLYFIGLGPILIEYTQEGQV